MKKLPFLSLSLTMGTLSLVLGVGCDSSSSGSGPDAPDASELTFDSGAPTSDEAAAPGIACPPPTGGPTQHGGSVNTETWTAAGSPHVLPYDTSVYGVLTLEPCAEVLIGAAKTVTVGANAKILATGSATKPIHIGAKDAAAFANIRTLNGGTLSLSYVNIDGGGDPLNTVLDNACTLDLTGDQTLPTQPILFVDHVTLKGSKSNGMVLHGGAGFAPPSTALTITGSAHYPMNIWSRAVDAIPTGTYTGNGHDEILLPTNALAEAVQDDATLRDRGVPYHVGTDLSAGTLYIGKATGVGLATLTVEPGVTLRMKKGGVIYVERATGADPARGALIAAGTAAKRVVFTSAEATPAAGDWLGIWFGNVPVATNKIDFAKISYAGGTSASGSNACNKPPIGFQNDAAIRIFGPPATQFVTNTIIEASAAHGVDRGWRANNLTDFLPTNTFMGIGRCTESFPRDLNGACPADPVPCPQ